MILGIVRPLIACAILIGLVLAGRTTETYNVDPIFYCAYGVARADARAADVLFVGNSQTGASIDRAYIGDLLAGRGAPRIEKLAQIRSSATTIRMLSAEYLRNRGAPRLVILQPMFVRYTRTEGMPGEPVHSRESIAYEGWDDLIRIRDEAVQAENKGWLPRWARDDYRSKAALWIDRQSEQIIAAFTSLRRRAQAQRCRGEGKFALASHWPDRILPLRQDADAGPLWDENDRRARDRRFGERLDLRTGEEWRAFELDQNRSLIAAFEQAGSEVVLVAYPTLNREGKDAAEVKELAQVFGREVIDLRAGLDADERRLLNQSYRDPVHLNFAGAQILSEQMAEELRGRSR